ncbi:MAG: hypothetical protein EPO39_07035 [Candidatus Manganitrophaceae bacterium]|nr:MAG: hypothetical protein EPO39_07035 [Candidatus Manganitrophaceae bacterium]
MMGTWRRIRRDLVLAATGFQEATIAIAERVHHRVQQVKISMEMSDLERQIKNRQALLGEKTYRKFEAGRSDMDLLSQEPVISDLSREIDALQNQLTLVEERSTEEEPIRVFEHALEESGLLLQHIVIPHQFPWVGKPIQEWNLPTEMRILYVRREKGIEIAHGRTVVEPHDQVTYIGPRRKTHLHKWFWLHSE